MTAHLVPHTHPNSVVCLHCAIRKRSAWRKFKTAMAVGAVIASTAYAGYCVYKQRIVTFTEVVTAARKAVDWIESRIENDVIMRKELAAVRKDLAEARRSRDEARRETKAMSEHMKRMEQALKGCIYRPRPRVQSPRPAETPRYIPWPFGGS